MNVTEIGAMPCGTKIQIEDWHEDYKFFAPKSTLAAYPISKVNMNGEYSPKINRPFRASFNFDDEKTTKQAFNELKEGSKQLIDFKEHINNPDKLECI